MADEQDQGVNMQALQSFIARSGGSSHAVSGDVIEDDSPVDATNHGSILDYVRRNFPEAHPAHQMRMKNGLFHRNFTEFAYAMGGFPYGEADEQTWQRLVAQARPHWTAVHRPDPALEIPVEPSEADVLRNRVDALEKMLAGIVQQARSRAIAAPQG